MYYVFESSTGLSLFKEDNHQFQLVTFHQFQNLQEAFEQQKSVLTGELTNVMQEFINSNFVKNFKSEKLGVSDQHLAQALKDKYEIKVICSEETLNIHRKIQQKLFQLIPKLNKDKEKQYSASLAHNFSRYQIQFNSESIDSMILQSVNILDESEKEINNYAMRLAEWVIWSFPEAAKVITDMKTYAKLMSLIGGDKFQLQKEDVVAKLQKFIEADSLQQLKQYSQVSVGTEITQEDCTKIRQLADMIISLTESKDKLELYIQQRMLKIAPNFTNIVGPLIGARLLAKAGSLLKLAKYPASTIQILGAEATLFKALKSKSKTPKYGFIYNCQLMSQAAQKEKGKVARKIAQNAAICVRYDALHEGELEQELYQKYYQKCQLNNAVKSKLQKKDNLNAFKLQIVQEKNQKDVVKKGQEVVEVKKNDKQEKLEKQEKLDKQEKKDKEEKKNKEEKLEKKEKEEKAEKKNKDEEKKKDKHEEKDKKEHKHKDDKEKDEKKEKKEKKSEKEEKNKDKEEKEEKKEKHQHKEEKEKHKDKDKEQHKEKDKHKDKKHE